MSLSIPNTFTPGTKARANEVNANFSAVAAKFTEGAGGISDVDIAAGAGIKASKLSSVAGQRVTASQLEDDAVDSRVLKDDPGAGHPNAAVALADQIKDRIITKEKIVLGTLTNAELAPGTVALDRLKVTLYSHAAIVGETAPGSLHGTFNTGLATGTTQPILCYSAVNSPLAAFGFYQNGGTWWVEVLFDGGVAFPSFASNNLKVLYLATT